MNKKIVFIIVLIECFLAVLLIGIFGQAIFSAINKKPVTEIYFTYKDGAKIQDGINLEEELSDSNRDVQLYWVVLPDDASEQKVVFTCSKPDVAIVSESGLVTFFEDEAVTITVQTLDGSNHTDVIVVVPTRRVGGNVDI